jgi:hypothetical protein
VHGVEVQTDAMDRIATAFERIAGTMERRVELDAIRAEAERRQARALENIAADSFNIATQLRKAVEEFAGVDEVSEVEGKEDEDRSEPRAGPSNMAPRRQLATMKTTLPPDYDPRKDPSRRPITEEVDYSPETPPEERETAKDEKNEAENAGEADMDTAE